MSCHRFRSHEVRLWLSPIAYNLGNLWPGCSLGPVLPLSIGNCSLTSPQQRVVKTGSRLVKHARDYWLVLAEGHLKQRLLGGMLRRGPEGPRRCRPRPDRTLRRLSKQAEEEERDGQA